MWVACAGGTFVLHDRGGETEMVRVDSRRPAEQLLSIIGSAPLTAVLTGEVPRLVDRLHFTATAAPRQVLHLLGNVVVAAAVTYGLGWEIAGGAPVAVALVGVTFVAYVVWYARLVWWFEGELWSAYLLDLPRRRRAIPGRRPARGRRMSSPPAAGTPRCCCTSAPRSGGRRHRRTVCRPSGGATIRCSRCAGRARPASRRSRGCAARGRAR